MERHGSRIFRACRGALFAAMGLLIGPAAQARAETLVWEFEIQVVALTDLLGQSGLAVGDPMKLSVSFDPADAVDDLPDPQYGRYFGVLREIDFELPNGPVHVPATGGSGNRIFVENQPSGGQYDIWAADRAANGIFYSTTNGEMPSGVTLDLQLIDRDATIFTSDALPMEVPPFGLIEETDVSIGVTNALPNGIFISGLVTDVRSGDPGGAGVPSFSTMGMTFLCGLLGLAGLYRLWANPLMANETRGRLHDN